MNRKTRIYLLLLINIIALVGLLFAYRYDKERTNTKKFIPDTRTTGEITVYTAYPLEQAETYIKLFEEEYPDIKVNLVVERTTALTNKIFEERDNPQADVVWGLSVMRTLLLEWNDMLKRYKPLGFDLIDEKFKPEHNLPKWTGLDVRMIAFCVNSAGLEEQGLPIPQSWADLANPIYKDKIILSVPASATSGYLVLSTALQLYADETDGWDYLERVNANVGEYVDGGSASCEKVGAGDYLIGVGFVYQMIDFKADGVPIDIIFPTEGVGWETQVIALVNKNNLKQAAQTFVSWAIAEPAMSEYAKKGAITGLKTNVPIPNGYPQDLNDYLLDQDTSWMTANRDRIIRDWEKRFKQNLPN